MRKLFLANSRNDNMCNMNLARISSCLIFIIITSLIGEELNNSCNLRDTSLPYYVKPVHYHIKLTHMYMKARFIFIFISKLLNYRFWRTLLYDLCSTDSSYRLTDSLKKRVLIYLR